MDELIEWNETKAAEMEESAAIVGSAEARDNYLTTARMLRKNSQALRDFKRCIEYLNYLGIDPMDGGPTAEVIVAMRIQELQRELQSLQEGNERLREELSDFRNVRPRDERW